MRSLKRIAVIGSLATLAIGGAALPAFAQSTSGPGEPNPVTLTVTVPSALSLTVANPALAFGTVVPGTSGTATETETVTGNSPYQLYITRGSPTMDSGTASISMGALSVADTVNGNAGGSGAFVSASPVVLFTSPAGGPVAGQDNFSDAFTFTVPASALPGNYSGTINYVMVAQ